MSATTEQIRSMLAAKPELDALGEPQWWIYLESGRSLEVTYESDGLPKQRRYCSIRLHCTEEEFDADRYRATLGVIDHDCTEDQGVRTLSELLDEAATTAALFLSAHREEIQQKGERA